MDCSIFCLLRLWFPLERWGWLRPPSLHCSPPQLAPPEVTHYPSATAAISSSAASASSQPLYGSLLPFTSSFDCLCWKSLSSDFNSSVCIQKSCNLSSRRSFPKNTSSRVSCSAVEVEDGTNDEACELVSGVELSLGEGADSFEAYLFKAVKNNNGTGLLLLSDVFGFEDSSTRDFAYRIACNGYK